MDQQAEALLVDTRLSVLDCLMPKTYIKQILCFPGPADPDIDAVVLLGRGLNATVHDLPYLARSVVEHIDANANATLSSRHSSSFHTTQRMHPD